MFFVCVMEISEHEWVTFEIKICCFFLFCFFCILAQRHDSGFHVYFVICVYWFDRKQEELTTPSCFFVYLSPRKLMHFIFRCRLRSAVLFSNPSRQSCSLIRSPPEKNGQICLPAYKFKFRPPLFLKLPFLMCRVVIFADNKQLLKVSSVRRSL